MSLLISCGSNSNQQATAKAGKDQQKRKENIKMEQQGAMHYRWGLW